MKALLTCMRRNPRAGVVMADVWLASDCWRRTTLLPRVHNLSFERGGAKIWVCAPCFSPEHVVSSEILWPSHPTSIFVGSLSFACASSACRCLKGPTLFEDFECFVDDCHRRHLPLILGSGKSKKDAKEQGVHRVKDRGEEGW